MSHTPGPWQAGLDLPEVANNNPDKAAAPDLLAAAKHLLDVIAEPDEIVREMEMDNAVQALADAITRAEGGDS